MGRSAYIVGQPTVFEPRILERDGVSLGLPIFAAYANSSATIITCSATPHALSTYAQITAATAEDYDWIAVNISGTSTTTADTRSLLTIGIGGAGAEVPIISEIPSGFASSSTPILTHWFPVHIPKGSRVAGAARGLIASDQVSVQIGYYRSHNPQKLQSPAKLITLGADTANSRGTNMPSSNTYVQVTAATPQAFQGVIMCPCGGTGTTYAAASVLYTLGRGASGAEVVLATDYIATTTAEIIGRHVTATPATGTFPFSGMFFGHVPHGSRLAVKQATGVNYRDAILFGIPY